MSQTDYRVVPLSMPIPAHSRKNSQAYAMIHAAVMDRTAMNGWELVAVLVSTTGQPLRLNNPDYWLVDE